MVGWAGNRIWRGGFVGPFVFPVFLCFFNVLLMSGAVPTYRSYLTNLLVLELFRGISHLREALCEKCLTVVNDPI